MKEKKQTNSNFLDRRGFIDDGFFFIIPYLRAISLSGVWSGTMKREGIGKNEKVGSVVYKNDKIIIIASNNNDNVVAKKPGDNRV